MKCSEDCTEPAQRMFHWRDLERGYYGVHERWGIYWAAQQL